MPPDHKLHGRQIWAIPTPTSSSVTRHCTPFTLPSRGVLTIDLTSVLTLTQNAVFRPECTGGVPIDPSTGGSAVVDLRDPFYASTSPQIYVTAAATVLSYMLVIMLLITPRTFFVGEAGVGGGFLGRRGMLSGASGSTSVVGIGRRPWLQKVAALAVAVSLTMATADTFKVAERQYNVGYLDASALTDEVVGGLEIRIAKVISYTCLWLAQVQTLIRLFPRHKEKVIIKWTGFALIVLDTIFSILDNFVDDTSRVRPRRFVDAIPALSYLFDLALSLLYAACVIYYSLSKRRFAFFHPKMRNICLVAVLSLTAVLIPVVFFVLDLSKPNVAGWGDYVRWVGAAAASVVVWEWVERIEAMERDERKDGILGREIFDGDEMLEVTPSEEVNWPHGRRGPGTSGGKGGDGGVTTTGWGGMTNVANHTSRSRLPPHYGQYHHRTEARDRRYAVTVTGAVGPSTASHGYPPTPPLAAASPVSRADTTSAASTIYVIHHHPVSEPTPTIPEAVTPGIKEGNGRNQAARSLLESTRQTPKHGTDNNPSQAPMEAKTTTQRIQSVSRWQNVTNPFKRRRASPPFEVSGVTSRATEPRSSGNNQSQFRSGSHPLGRLRIRRGPRSPDAPTPVVIIPAQPRGRVWSPAISEYVEITTPVGVEGPTGGSFLNGNRAKGKAIERETPPINSVDRSRIGPSPPPDIPSRSSTTTVANTVLSQRGNLTICEERPRRNPTYLPLRPPNPSSNEVLEPSPLEPQTSANIREYSSTTQGSQNVPSEEVFSIAPDSQESPPVDEEHVHLTRPPES